MPVQRPVMTLPELLAQRVNAVLPLLSIDLPAGTTADVTIAADLRFGDYQTNTAMILAKQLRLNPQALAKELVEKMDVSDLSAPPTVAGPGFINFQIKPELLAQRLTSLLADPHLGVPQAATPNSAVIHFPETRYSIERSAGFGQSMLKDPVPPKSRPSLLTVSLYLLVVIALGVSFFVKSCHDVNSQKAIDLSAPQYTRPETQKTEKLSFPPPELKQKESDLEREKRDFYDQNGIDPFNPGMIPKYGANLTVVRFWIARLKSDIAMKREEAM